MAKEKSKEALKAQNQVLRAKIKSNTTGRAVEAISKWGGIATCFYFAKEAISVLAGKETWAHIKLVAEGCSFDCKWALVVGGVALAIGIICAIIGIVYGVLQRQMRREVIKEKSDRIIDLEKQLDKKRTSSGLTETGETNKGR